MVDNLNKPLLYCPDQGSTLDKFIFGAAVLVMILLGFGVFNKHPKLTPEFESKVYVNDEQNKDRRGEAHTVPSR